MNYKIKRGEVYYADLNPIIVPSKENGVLCLLCRTTWEINTAGQ